MTEPHDDRDRPGGTADGHREDRTRRDDPRVGGPRRKVADVTVPARTARVRPYALTRGRTRARHPLLLESLISVPAYDPGVHARLAPEYRDLYRTCREVRSVVEISAELGLPLGVVRVLLSDLADQGAVRVHGTTHTVDTSGTDLLERVLRGLQTLSR